MAQGFHDGAWNEVLPFLRRAMECPVCLDTIKPPARQCSNGHVTCSLCVVKLKNCSLCRRPFLQENPTFVNSLLEALPRSCRHGCGRVLAGSGVTNTHEDFCGYRHLQCRHSNCTAPTRLNQMKNHYERGHARSLLVKCWRIDLTWNNFHLGQDQTWNVAVFLNGCFFYVSKFYSEKEKVLKIVFEAFPAQESPFEYYVSVMLEMGDFVANNTIKAIVRKGDIDLNGFDVAAGITENNQDFCMKVSKDMLSQIICRNTLVFSYSFFKRQKR